MKRLDKKFIIMVTIIVVLMMTLLIGYRLDQKRQLKVIKLYGNTAIIENKKEILYSIESINFSNGLGSITGWAVIKGENSYNIMPNVILKSQEGDLYKIKTRIVKRKDITRRFNGETVDDNTHLTMITRSKAGITRNKNVYDNCGINSEFQINDLKRNQSYKIGIELQSNGTNYFVWTDKELVL